MWSACLDEYQYAVGWHYDLVLFGRNGRVLILTQGFLDLLLDLEQGGVQRGGLPVLVTMVTVVTMVMGYG